MKARVVGTRVSIELAILPWLVSLASCGPAGPNVARHVVLEENEYYGFASEVLVLADRLYNPVSPLPHDTLLIYAESGRGIVASQPIRGGARVEQIHGFRTDEFAGYVISAQGITIDPSSGAWIVAAAEGPGRVVAFDPSRFPIEAGAGTEIELAGAVDDNPWETVFLDDLLVASGGTSKAYAGMLDLSQSATLDPIIEVETGVIGIAADAESRTIYGAVFGAGPGSGSIVAWDADRDFAPSTLVDGLSHPVDVAMTPEGLLVIVQFGDFQTAGTGSVLVAPKVGGPARPLLSGLNAPSGIAIHDGWLYVTEFGATRDDSSGQLLAVQLTPRAPGGR